MRLQPGLLRQRVSLSLLGIGVCLCSAAARAADWPQFRGPNRDAVSPEKGLLAEWPKAGPPLAWTYKDAGIGYSGPAVGGGRLYLAGARGGSEFLFALDTKD